jgi:hypothetical protein
MSLREHHTQFPQREYRIGQNRLLSEVIPEMRRQTLPAHPSWPRVPGLPHEIFVLRLSLHYPDSPRGRHGAKKEDT